MIFDDINRASAPGDPAPRMRRRSSRRAVEDSPDAASRRRRRSNFSSASRLPSKEPSRGGGSTKAWLAALALLVVAALGFAAYLQKEKGAKVLLPGSAPSSQLLAFVDPVLAPLETGRGGFDAKDLNALSDGLSAARATVSLDDREIYSVAGTLAGILQEAAIDRDRHLQRLVGLGSSVRGMNDDTSSVATLDDKARRHHELAVAVSWQRNSGTYRNRVEELWYRLLRLEQGRFRGGSGPASMTPELPTLTPPNE